MKKSISCGMLFIGIATGLLGCAAEGLPTDEEMMAEETGLEIVADPGDSIGAESVALDDTSAEDFALMAAADDENQLIPEDESGTSGGTSGGTSAASCGGNCQTYHGPCSGFGGQFSKVECEGEQHTETGPNVYAWMTICGSCGTRYKAAAGRGYCWW